MIDLSSLFAVFLCFQEIIGLVWFGFVGVSHVHYWPATP